MSAGPRTATWARCCGCWSTGQLDVEPLIGLELPVGRAAEAYAAINGESPPLAAVLTYDGEAAVRRETVRDRRPGLEGRPPRPTGPCGSR